MSRFDDLERLAKLLDEGKLTQEEYDRLKKEVLDSPEPPPEPPSEPSAAQRAGEAVGRKFPGLGKAIPASKEETQKKKSGQGCLVLIIAVIVLAAISSMCNGGGGEVTPRGETQEHEAVEAYVVCQQFVEDRLRAPSTAEFGGPYSQVTQHLGGGRYRVDTYVDAENAFGAMIRNDFVCVVDHVSGDRYTLESLVMEE